MSNSSDEIITFSQELGGVLYGISQFYPPMFISAVQVAQSPPSPSAESELVEIRQGATELSDTLVVYSRLISLMEGDLQSGAAPSQHDPRIVRPLLLDLLESAVMLAHVPSQADLAGLSIMTPEDLESRLSNPQLSMWMQHNVTDADKQEYDIEQYIDEAPVEAQPQLMPETQSPTYAQPVAPLEASPYPQVEPELPSTQQPIEPLSPPPSSQQAAQPEPWQQPVPKPSTEGERSRHRQR